MLGERSTRFTHLQTVIYLSFIFIGENKNTARVRNFSGTPCIALCPVKSEPELSRSHNKVAYKLLVAGLTIKLYYYVCLFYSLGNSRCRPLTMFAYLNYNHKTESAFCKFAISIPFL